MALLLEALPATLKVLKLQRDHFSDHKPGVNHGGWFHALPNTLEKLIVRTCIVTDEQLMSLPTRLTHLEGTFEGDFKWTSIPRQLKTLKLGLGSNTTLKHESELPPHLETLRIQSYMINFKILVENIPSTVRRLNLSVAKFSMEPEIRDTSILPPNLRELWIPSDTSHYDQYVKLISQRDPWVSVRKSESYFEAFRHSPWVFN